MYISLLSIRVTALRSLVPYLSAITIICFFHYVQGLLCFCHKSTVCGTREYHLCKICFYLAPSYPPPLCRRSLVRRSSSAAARWSSTRCVFTPGSWLCVWGVCERAFCLLKPDSLRVLRRENRHEDCGSESMFHIWCIHHVCAEQSVCGWENRSICHCWELWMYDTDWRGVMVLTHWLARCQVFSLQSFRSSSAKWTLRFFSYSCLVIIIILAKL